MGEVESSCVRYADAALERFAAGRPIVVAPVRRGEARRDVGAAHGPREYCFVTHAEADEIRSLSQAGMRPATIARRLNMAANTVEHFLACPQPNVVGRRKQRRKGRLTP